MRLIPEQINNIAIKNSIERIKQKYSFNKNSEKVIWIDFDNSPHVPFFAPIIRRLKHEGYSVKISARNYSQTVALAKLYNLDFKVIGKHFGINKFAKVLGLIYRSIQLFPFAFKSKPTIAISHGSRSQILVASLLRIPTVLFLDYEFIQIPPIFKPGLIFLPNLISKDKLKRFSSKVKTYPGIKEDIYVPSFKPDLSIKKKFNITNDKITVVVRPPAYKAHYHNKKSDILFNEVIKFLTSTESVQTIILPRDDTQKQYIYNKFNNHFKNKKLIIPDEVMNGLNLMWFSDLVISGGGTMNREATALGIPVYSIFKGEIGDVDKYLSETKRLVIIENWEDIKTKIKLVKRNQAKKIDNINSFALQSIINNLNNFINNLTNSELENFEIKNDAKKLRAKREQI